MEDKKFFKLLLSYIYRCRFCFIGAVLSVLIFLFVFIMYGVSISVLWYPILLSLFIFGCFFTLGFYKFYKKHKELINIKKNIELFSEFDMSGDLIEQDYIKIIQKLALIRTNELTSYNMAQKDTSDYYAVWVHQIKAPIAVMRVLLQENDTKENRILLSELFRIEQYAEMALGYIRLEDNSSDLLLKEFPLDEIIRKSIRKFAPQIIDKHITMSYSGTDEVVLTDEKWLSFIIEQLLSNAVKYTDKGGITITVDKNKHMTISDTGIGISEEDLPRIFEKGYTGYNGRLGSKSTGIGLYLCKTAADKLGHQMTVTSNIGRGSSFTVDLSSYEFESE